MARAYDDDLRRKILEAYERDPASYQKMANRFGVSHGYVYNIRKQQLKTGKMVRVPQSQNGRTSRLTPEIRESMRAWMAEQPDLTLAKLQKRLDEQFHLGVSIGQIWLVLKAMGLRLKKSYSTFKNERSQKRARDSNDGEQQNTQERL